MVDNRSTKLIKNTLILTIGNLCTKGIMFIMTPLFTRWLSQEAYGTFDMLATYIALIAPIITLDIKEGVFRFLISEENVKDKGKILTNGIFVHLVGFGFSFLIVIIMIILLPNNKMVILSYCLMIMSETLYDLWVVISRGLKKISVFAIGNIIYVIVMAVVSVVVVGILKYGLYGLILSYTIGYLVSAIFMLIKCKTFGYISLKHLDLAYLRKMIDYSLPMIPNSIAWWIMNVSDRTILTLFVGVEANAVLAVTSKLPNLCQQLFSKFHLSWQETAVDSLNAIDRDDYYSKVMNNLFELMSSGVIIILALNFAYFKFLFSEDYFLGYYLSPVLLVAILFYVMTQFLGGIYIANMDSVKTGKTTMIAATINLTVDLLLIKYVGIWAAVISTLIAYFVLFIIRFNDIRKTVNLKFSTEIFCYIAMIGYIIITIYINSTILSFISFIIACIFTLYKNRNYLNLIIVKIRRKRK